MRASAIVAILFMMLLVLPALLAAGSISVVYASEETGGTSENTSMTGTGTGEYGGMMPEDRYIAVVRATALNTTLLIVDSIVLNVTFNEDFPGGGGSWGGLSDISSEQQVTMMFVGFSYRRAPVENGTVEHYVIHYVNISVSAEEFLDMVKDLKEKGYEWHSNMTQMACNTSIPTESIKDSLKERIKERKEMLKDIINASIFAGVGKTATLEIWLLENGTVIVDLIDGTGGLVYEEVQEHLVLDEPKWQETTNATVVYHWKLANVTIKFMSLVSLTKSLWSKDTGPLALTLDAISGEPLKPHFGVYAMRFSTLPVEMEHCVMVAGTVTTEKLQEYMEGLEGYKVVLILRTITTPIEEASEMESEDIHQLISAVNSTVEEAPQVERFIVVMRRKVNISAGEKCLLDISNGSVVIQKDGKMAICIYVKGNATLYVESIGKANITIVSKKYVIASEYVLEVSSEAEIEGTIEIRFKIPEGVNTSEVKIAYYDENLGEWVTVETHIVEEDGELYAVAETSHTSLWALVTPVEEGAEGEGVTPTPTLQDFIPHITVVLLILLALGLSAYAIRKRSM
ncbi:MAG: hypothetical protein ACTSXX_14280 [Candidatus Baldrarchaeia archaeon]